jgi:hypothetical protein
MMSGARGWKDRLWSSLQYARLSCRLLGDDVVGVQDVFWRSCRLALLHLVAKPSHVGVDVDGLACRLRCPTNYG